MAESKLDEMLRSRKAPGLAGCSTGPGSCEHEMVFDRPDPVKDGRIILRRMEESGQLRDPKVRAAAMAKWNAVKNRPAQKVDYGKDGHPLDRKPTYKDD